MIARIVSICTLLGWSLLLDVAGAQEPVTAAPAQRLEWSQLPEQQQDLLRNFESQWPTLTPEQRGATCRRSSTVDVPER